LPGQGTGDTVLGFFSRQSTKSVADEDSSVAGGAGEHFSHKMVIAIVAKGILGRLDKAQGAIFGNAASLAPREEDHIAPTLGSALVQEGRVGAYRYELDFS